MTDNSEISKTSDVCLQPSRQLSKLFNSYAKAINRAYNRTGSLFENRYGRILIDSEEHLSHLISYIHYNPQKHGLINDFRKWPYSSYAAIRYQKSSRLEAQKVMDLFGNSNDFDQSHTLMNQRPEIIADLMGDDD